MIIDGEAMSRTADEILNEAKTLSADDRARLAEELLRTIELPDQAEIDAAWAREAEDRLEKFRSGQTTAIPVEQAIEELRKELRERK